MKTEADFQKLSDRALETLLEKENAKERPLGDALSPAQRNTVYSELRKETDDPKVAAYVRQRDYISRIYEHQSERKRLGSSYVRKRQPSWI